MSVEKGDFGENKAGDTAFMSLRFCPPKRKIVTEGRTDGRTHPLIESVLMTEIEGEN